MNSIIEELTNRLEFAEHREKRLFNSVDPWENCLRFYYRMNCKRGSSKSDPTSPPCLVDILEVMAFATLQIFEARNLNHFVSYGSLLGSVRNESIIEWTSDFDIVVEESHFNLIKIASTGFLSKYGLVYFTDKKYPDIGRICATPESPWNKFKITKPNDVDYFDAYPYVDIYQLVNIKQINSLMIKFGPPCKFTMDEIYPFSKTKIYGREVFAPAKPHEFLKKVYGPDYMIPLSLDQRGGHGLYSEACIDTEN